MMQRLRICAAFALMAFGTHNIGEIVNGRPDKYAHIKTSSATRTGIDRYESTLHIHTALPLLF